MAEDPKVVAGEEGGIGDAVLREIAEALDNGVEPDLDELKVRHPGRARQVELLLRGAQRYRALKFRLEKERHDPPILAAGTVLGDFTIESLLGRGGMGTVYRARQSSLGDRVVALKVLHRANVADRAEASFRQEALAAAALHHPHLAEVYGFGTSDSWLFYAMRLVEGPTLHDVLAHLKTSPARAAEASTQRLLVQRIAEVCSALAAVHAAGLVHRDVKPGNIMLEGGREGDILGLDRPAVLVDFGLIRPKEPEAPTRTRTTTATPAYAAPEVLLGKAVDARADVFSLGATLHDLLAGRLPADRVQASAGMDPLEELVPRIDQDLAAVVHKAVDPDPEWRYPDAAAFLADLDAWRAMQPVKARPRGLVEGAVLYVRQHPGPALRLLARGLGIALAVALVVVLGVAVTYRYSRSRSAGAAFAEGDIHTLGTIIDELNQRSFGLIFLENRVEEVARRFAGGDDDPIERVFWRLKEKDPRGALLIAATHLHQDKGRDFALRSFLCRTLESACGEQSYAVYLAARIFLERPDTTPGACQASEPLRRCLAGLWQNSGAAPADRIWALAALGGCGTPALVPEIMDWAGRHDALSEERRLGLAAAGLILQRAGPCATLGELASGGLDEIVQTAARMSDIAPADGDTETHDRLADQLHQAKWLFAKGIAFAARSLNVVVDSELTRFEEFDEREVTGLQAIQRSIDSRETWLRTALPTNDGVLPTGSWGDWCGYLEDDDLARRIRKLIAEQGAESVAGYLRDFNDALSKAQAEVRGISRSYIDEESHLTVEVDRTLTGLGAVDAAQSGESGRFAQWDFRKHPVEISGAAREAWQAGTTFYGSVRESASFRRLFSAGQSRIRLGFEVAEPEFGQSLILELVHLAAFRPYFPFGGEVEIEVSLDGKHLEWIWVQPKDLISVERSFTVHTIRVPGFWLNAGIHDIDIAMKDSTTTYWLYRASLMSAAE